MASVERHFRGRSVSLELPDELENITGTSKRQREPGATLPVGVHDAAHGTVALRPQFALNAHIGSTEWTKTLYKRCVGIVFRVLETVDKVVAALTHADDLRAVQGEIEFVFVRLSEAAKDEGVVVAGNDEHDVLVFAAGVVVGDSEGFDDFWESLAIVDDADESAAKRVDGGVAREKALRQSRSR